MDTYDLMRAFADSWVLLAMTLFFLGVVVRSLNPGRAREMREAAAIPLDERTPRDFEKAASARRSEAREGGEQ